MKALEHRFRAYIGLLPLNAPIFQLLERDRRAGDRTAHEGAGAHDAKISVKITDLRFSGGRKAMIKPIEHVEDSR